MRYGLRTLLVLMAVGPPLLALAWLTLPLLRSPKLPGMISIVMLGWLVSSPVWIPFMFAGYAVGRKDCTTQFLVAFAIAELVSIALCAGVFIFIEPGLR
jgi:hypothetical protein